ncbi:uncharacterized protein LOC114530578 isoform X2 [Dendronephthya gigantea]|uniref:uncharacterized protein LOC114530578 isoform X2 n=1 Tax=Dendronephthya gigantea TaxID=151771 RepID=UPI0010690C14|nr:uncharacterized protein LOC114530578 isoform X2 [Dendronephthya gigantea]
MLVSTFCVLISCLFVIEAQFVIDRGERDVFRNLTGCTKDFCYYLHAEESKLDPCVCRCLPKYPMYRNPDVAVSGGMEFTSKGYGACVWHSNHRYECYHIRKLGRGAHTRDGEDPLEFDLSDQGSLLAYADHDLSSCAGVDSAIKMPEDIDFTPMPGLLNVTYRPANVIRFEWTASEKRFDGGILRGVLKDCSEKISENERCFVGKVIGTYNGGSCDVRAANGDCCIFPFTYDGKEYNNCIKIGSEEAWCAVKLPFFGNETNWKQNCLQTTKVFQSSLATLGVSQHKTEPISATKTVLIQSSTSILPLVSTQVLISAHTMDIRPLGPNPVPKATMPISKENETISFDKSSTQILTQLSTTNIDRASLTDDNTSSIIVMKTMVNYKSSIVDKALHNKTSAITRTAVANITSETIHEITPSPEIKKSMDFTSSVSPSIPITEQSTIDHSSTISSSVSSIIVGQIISASNSISKMSDHSSSVSDHERLFSGYKQTLSIYTVNTTQYKQTFITGSNNSSQIIATSTNVQMTSSISSAVLPETKATASDGNNVAIIIVIVMAAVAFVVIFFVCCLFLGRRKWKNRTKKYRVINKKTGGQATQSPATQRTDTENPIQNDIVNVEESGSEMAETEFTIPEKNAKEISDGFDKPGEKQCGPEFMTYRL